MTSSYKRVYSFCETPPGVIKAVDCGIGTPANIEYSHFNSQDVDAFNLDFSAFVFKVIAPNNPVFPMYNLASSSPNSGISSSGASLQFINTNEAGSYEFDVHFSIQNPDLVNFKPTATITLGTSTGIPYINANGFLQLETLFQPFITTADPKDTTWFVSMHGVVDLPAVASTAILLKSSFDFTFLFGPFNVTVKKLA